MEQKHTIWRLESPRAFGTALRAARKQKGLSQERLADNLGTTRHLISRLERGEVPGQIRLLLRILDRLDMQLCVESR